MNGEIRSLKEFKEAAAKEIKIVNEIISTYHGIDQGSNEEKSMLSSHIQSLKTILSRTIDDISNLLDDLSMTKPLSKNKATFEMPKTDFSGSKKTQVTARPYFEEDTSKKHKIVDISVDELDRKTIRRLKKKEKVQERVKERKPSKYISLSNKFFGDVGTSLSKKKMFITLKRDLIKAHLQYTAPSFISVLIFSTLLAFIAGFFIAMFLMFFKISFAWPIITSVSSEIGSRFLMFFWIMILLPVGTALIIYTYPSLEKGYIANKIEQELPFATIHMSAIAGSLVEPSKMFNIIISTRDYPYLERELIKIINEINVYGYDLINALRNVGFNSPSQRLAELLNGIAITINSGGNLQDFFDKRAQSLLFEYRIEREKYAKSAETFMDIYISLVIAAPMILMLMLIMMRVSGLGISISTAGITLIMVLGVVMINIIFLTFLKLKQPSG